MDRNCELLVDISQRLFILSEHALLERMDGWKSTKTTVTNTMVNMTTNQSKHTLVSQSKPTLEDYHKGHFAHGPRAVTMKL